MIMEEMIKERVKKVTLRKRVMSSDEAASLVSNGMRVATSGSLLAGYPISFFKALVRRSKTEKPFKIDLWSAAPLGPEIDGELVEAGIIRKRLCHQANRAMARAINNEETLYADMGPYQFANQVRYGFLGGLDLAVIEAVQIEEGGEIIPSTCLAECPTLLKAAQRVVVEINGTLPLGLKGIHDILIPDNPPNRQVVPLTSPADRVGTPYIPLDLSKILGIIISTESGKEVPKEETSEESHSVARQLMSFFESEVSKGTMPENLLPLQTGLGSLGEAVLEQLGQSDFEGLQTFSALLSDSILDLIDLGKIRFASGTGLYFSSKGFARFYNDTDRYKKFMILRPVDISTYPELIQRLGVIAMNGAIEVDIYGHVNSSHVGGGRVVTGVGGSIEYARNGSLSIFMTPSTGKGGEISRIVPMVSHVDHTEHDVHIVVTEQGVADLRGLDPRERALEIISSCAHPAYRPLLKEYFDKASSEVGGHEPQLLDEAFSFQKRLRETGSMKI
jgi:succinyl-CoA:acetate CoA-transferase